MTARALSKIDLNLLVVLDVLLREKSVARAAARLNLTSSAVSHALKRLRLLFDNELLVRDGRRMVPTARAEVLAETLPAVLSSIERTLAEPEAFNPATSTRVFRLATPDFFSPLIPKLLKRIGQEAPAVQLEVSALPVNGMSDLRQGRYDALIAPSFKRSDELRGSALGAWPWVVFGREDHPAFADWSLEAWARFPHLQIGSGVAPRGSPIDRKVAPLGVTRRIGAVLTHFSMAPPVLAQTDMLLSIPSVALRDAAQVYRLAQRDLPFDVPPLELTLFRSASNGDEPEIRWFHAHVAGAAQALNSIK
ncbi:MAG: LysR substrate-binding domain-containing protein [Rhodobacter sp.]|nr:LysR substrate-binding domain-containing protein [Rhodobacter sp.]